MLEEKLKELETLPRSKKREKQHLVCEECGRTFDMSYERMLLRKYKYGKDLCNSCSRLSERNPFYGHKFSDEQKQQFSQIRKDYYNDIELGEARRTEQSERFEGSNNPMFIENMTKTLMHWRSPSLRLKTIVESKFTCYKCKQVKDEVELDVHHIESCNSAPEKRMHKDNSVCLCVRCHRIFHRIYGKGNNTKEQFESFMTESSETIEATANKLIGSRVGIK